MKILKNIVLVAILIISSSITAQTTNQCQLCDMSIKDKLHKASAMKEGTAVHFDAIECLVNYQKSNKSNTISDLKVTDYETGEFINAETSYYLKSKAIPSPMGAYLSAFSNKERAERMKSKKGGEVYKWEELKERFKNSDFGSLEHNHHNHSRPDAHAPIGVMGDHLHHKGGLMVSLRYMNMSMQGNMNGTSSVDDEAIYEDYMVAPQEMNMQMYMLGIMYAPTDRLTLMLMQNYVENNMDLTAQMRMGGIMMNGQMMGGMMMQKDFSTSSSGFGDMRLGALYGLYSDEKKSLHLNSQINLPIGSVTERDATPMNDDVKLPYRMQLGSGTVDFSLGATFKKTFSTVSLGTQILGTVRTGENTEGYRFGNQVQLNIWGAYLVHPNISISGRVQGVVEGEIEGNDEELNPNMITAADVDNYGGKGIRSFIGINLAFSEGSLFHKFRLGAEVGAPFYENYQGIQMNEGLNINCGVKYNIL